MSAGLLDGLARHLAAAGLGAYSTTEALPPDRVPIAVQAAPPGADTALVLTTYPGGPAPDSRNRWEYPRLQVKVRDRNPLDALDLDRAAFDQLQALVAELPGWHVTDCYALQSEAQPLGADDNGRHEYVRNYQLTVQPTTT